MIFNNKEIDFKYQKITEKFSVPSKDEFNILINEFIQLLKDNKTNLRNKWNFARFLYKKIGKTTTEIVINNLSSYNLFEERLDYIFYYLKDYIKENHPELLI